MTEQAKQPKCKCCLGLGVVVLLAGLVLGLMNDAGFGLVHMIAIVVGIIMIIAAIKKPGICKCCTSKKE